MPMLVCCYLSVVNGKKKSTTKQYVSLCVPSTFKQLKPHVFSKAAFYYVKILLKINKL